MLKIFYVQNILTLDMVKIFNVIDRWFLLQKMFGSNNKNILNKARTV